MTHEGELIKSDPTQGKRGSKVFYALTDKAKEKYFLRILGPDEKTRKRKYLYQLLVYFETYKRSPLITKRQLSKFLKQIGASMKDLKQERDIDMSDDITRIHFNPIKGVDILGIPQYDKNTKSNRIFYYAVLPGFSLEEFVSYLNLLKNKTEPRPFTANINLIPYARYIHFSKRETTEAISLLRKYGLVKTINPVIPGEKRFVMTDRFRNLTFYIWAIQRVDSNLLVEKLVCKKPTDKEREYLSLYMGERLADRILAYAFEIRKRDKKEKDKHDKDSEAIKSLEREREFLVQELMSSYKDTFKENEVVREILEGVCYSPLLKKESE
jgi:hypothetical protein